MAKRGKAKDDWTPQEKINIFIERIDELESTKLVASVLNISSTISLDREKGLNTQLPNIDKDELRSFLTVFRHFISNDEPVYLYGIFNICHQFLTNESLKNDTAELRNYWKKALGMNGFKFHLNNNEVKPEETIDIWINSWSHHSDREYRKLLESFAPWQRDIMQMVFLDALVEATNVICYAGSYVKEGLEQGYFSF